MTPHRAKGNKEKEIEFTSRYGDSLPNSDTMCKGECEGTGWIPVYKDETDEDLKRLWEYAHVKSHRCDGWHFIKCPKCNGTGKIEIEGILHA